MRRAFQSKTSLLVTTPLLEQGIGGGGEGDQWYIAIQQETQKKGGGN